MFKVKYKIWAGLLVLSFVLNFAIANIPSFFKELSKEVPVADFYISSTENSKLKNQLLNNMSTRDVSLRMVHSVNENTQVILANKLDKSINLTGYEKYSDVINSPIVLFSPRNARNESENFSVGIGNSYSLTKDLYEILVAIEEGKTWNDIGISKDVVSGNVSLVIPKSNNAYYPAVVETIYMTLNQNKDVLEVKDIDALKSRVDNILSKCTEVEDVSRYISNKRKDNNKKLDSLVLGPELIIIDDTNTYSTETDDWMPIYLNKTAKVSLDLYIKSGENLENIKYLFSRQTFTDKTGMRSELRSYKIQDKVSGYGSAIEIVEFGQVEEGVRSKIIENIPLTIKTASVKQTEAVATENQTEEVAQPTEVVKNTEDVVETTIEKVEETTEVANESTEKESEELNKELKVTDEGQEQSESETVSESTDEESNGNGGRLFVLLLGLVFFLIIMAIVIGGAFY